MIKQNNIIFIGSDNFILPRPGMIVLNKELIGIPNHVGLVLKVKSCSDNKYFLTILSFYVPCIVEYWVRSYEDSDFYGTTLFYLP